MKKTFIITLVALLAFTFCKKKDNHKKEIPEPAKNYLSRQWVNYWSAKLEYAALGEKRLAEAKKLNSQAFALYKAKRDKEAVELYEKSIDSYPLGETYYNYGNSLSNINRLEDSILAYEIALHLNTPRPELALYNIACSHSRLNQVNEAYDYLAQAIDRGYNAIAYIQKDPDMENLRKDPEWESKIQKLLNPKEYSKEELVGNLKIQYSPRGAEDYILCASGVAITPINPFVWGGGVCPEQVEALNYMYKKGKWSLENGDLKINFTDVCVPDVKLTGEDKKNINERYKGALEPETVASMCRNLIGTLTFKACNKIGNTQGATEASFTKQKVANFLSNEKSKSDTDVSYDFNKNSTEPKQCDPNFVPKTLEDLKLE